MRDVRIVAEPAALARAAADELVRVAVASLAARGAFTVALAGGSTPRRLYELIATGGAPAYRDRIDWTRTPLYVGDERHVPPTHPDSNFRMISEALLSRVPVPAANVFRFRSEESDPALAARLYEAELRGSFGLAGGEVPRFDLVLLGLGPDGH